jgi:hypothetical protein
MGRGRGRGRGRVRVRVSGQWSVVRLESHCLTCIASSLSARRSSCAHVLGMPPLSEVSIDPRHSSTCGGGGEGGGDDGGGGEGVRAVRAAVRRAVVTRAEEARAAVERVVGAPSRGRRPWCARPQGRGRVPRTCSAATPADRDRDGDRYTTHTLYVPHNPSIYLCLSVSINLSIRACSSSIC